MTHPAAEQFPAIRTWIQKQAAEQSLEGIRDYVASQYERLLEAIATVSESTLANPLAEGEWSAIEAFKHVVEWNWQVGEDVLHACLMGERPGNPRPSFPAERDALTSRLRESLDSVWAHVSAADPAAFLDVTWEHPFFGQLNWREWFWFLGVHAMDHTNQVKAAGGGDD